MSIPKIMNMMPEIIFNMCVGMIFVIHVPARIASPSTIINAMMIPSKSCRCCFVFDASNKIDICVLSPSSAIAIVKSGMSISSSICVSPLIVVVDVNRN